VDRTVETRLALKNACSGAVARMWSAIVQNSETNRGSPKIGKGVRLEAANEVRIVEEADG
jgi:hypothetical protein